jgi:ATP-binding cassette subfamily F protein 3
MLALRDVDVGYPAPGGSASSAGTAIVRGVNRSVMAGQRIGILGANGQGKSTLVKTIAGALPPLAGQITEGKGLSIGYFAQQELDVLRPQDTPLEHMVRLAREWTADGRLNGQPTREQDLRNFLGGFHFSGDMVKQTVGSMSGGEKARLVLCMIVWQRPNLLLLDEPTNHLDLATRDALSMAINGFEGTVMLVSHDRSLLRSVCDEFWLVADGQLSPFDGDLDDYQRYLLEVARRKRESASRPSARAKSEALATVPAVSAAPAPAPAPASASGPSSLTPGEQRRQDATLRQQKAEQARPHKKALAQTEARMASLEADKAALNQRLLQPLEAAEWAEAGRQLKALEDELQGLEERWLELSETLQQLGVAG